MVNGIQEQINKIHMSQLVLPNCSHPHAKPLTMVKTIEYDVRNLITRPLKPLTIVKTIEYDVRNLTTRPLKPTYGSSS